MKMASHKQILRTKSFTLIEILLVMGLITIIFGIIILAINPGRQLEKARNTQRLNDLRAISSAVQQYYIDNQEWPNLGLSNDLKEICNTTTLQGPQEEIDCGELIDLSVLVPNYLYSIPKDPLATGNNTLYQISINPNSGLVELFSPKFNSGSQNNNPGTLVDLEKVMPVIELALTLQNFGIFDPNFSNDQIIAVCGSPEAGEYILNDFATTLENNDDILDLLSAIGIISFSGENSIYNYYPNVDGQLNYFESLSPEENINNIFKLCYGRNATQNEINNF